MGHRLGLGASPRHPPAAVSATRGAPATLMSDVYVYRSTHQQHCEPLVGHRHHYHLQGHCLSAPATQAARVPFKIPPPPKTTPKDINLITSRSDQTEKKIGLMGNSVSIREACLHNPCGSIFFQFLASLPCCRTLLRQLLAIGLVIILGKASMVDNFHGG